MVYEPVRIGGYGSGEILSPAQGVIESDSGKVSEIWAALSRRKLVLFLAAACGLVGGLVPELVQTPVYRARTSLQLEGFNENYLNLRDLSPNSPLVANASAEAYLQNQLKILQSETLARRVAQGLQLAPERSRRAPSRLLSRVLERLGVPAQRRLSPEEARTTKVIKGTTVRSSLQSQILEVLFDSPDPALAAMVANAIASEYVAL